MARARISRSTIVASTSYMKRKNPNYGSSVQQVSYIKNPRNIWDEIIAETRAIGFRQ